MSRRKIIIINNDVKFAIYESTEVSTDQDLGGIVIGHMKDIGETTLESYMNVSFDCEFKCAVSRMDQLLSKIKMNGISLYQDVSDYSYYWYSHPDVIRDLQDRTFINPILVLITNH